MIKICRSCLAVTLAALMLTVPVVAADDQANQAAGKEREITKIRLKLHEGKAFPKYLGSKLTAPEEIVEEYQAGYVDERNAQRLEHRILKNVKLEYVTQNHKPYSDKILWPLKKNAQGYVYDESKALFLKLTFSVGEDGGYKYKIDVRKELPVEIGDPQFTIPAKDLKVGPDGTYTAYLPLKAYRKVKFIPDEGFTKFNLKGKTPELTNSLEYDVDLEDGKINYVSIKNSDIVDGIKDTCGYLGLFVEEKNNNKYFCPMNSAFAYRNLDESYKADALNPLVVNVRTKKKDGTSLIPPAINGLDATIDEGKKFDRLSLVDSFREEAGTENGDKEKIQFAYEPADFNPDNPAPSTYKVTMSYKNGKGLTATWTSTVTVVAKPKPKPPVVPAPQPQPKQQEKTGNAYFDLGRYLLPACPDSKCDKAGTGAKKDDVPNTAAAVNN